MGSKKYISSYKMITREEFIELLLLWPVSEYGVINFNE